LGAALVIVPGLPGAANAAVAADAQAAVQAKPHVRHVENPDTLWRLIHDGCAVAAARNAEPPAPCAEVTGAHDDKRGYVVFKDRNGSSQYLVLPLARITGIESPALLAPDAPNWFADAWTARLYVEAALHHRQPRDVLSLVVNSASGRTQNQLHIHVDCVRPAVHAALQRVLPSLDHRWRALDVPLLPNGHRYRAMWLAGETLTANPFKLLAAALPAGDRMARHSLAVVGAYGSNGAPGFILLSGSADPVRRDRGNAGELQDHTCALAVRAPE
jgi:CDP-diacylglycerol pyrophosphatase